MKNQTKEAIKTIIKNEIQKKLKDLPNSYKEAVLMQNARKPLHERILPAYLLVSNFLFQSLATRLGKTVFEKIARIIASENFDYVHPREYTLMGIIPDDTKTLIDTLVRRREHDSSMGIEYEIEQILNSIKNPSGQQRIEQETVDLYLKKKNEEYFIEMTTVKPNIKECRSFKRRQLAIIAIVKKPIIPLIGMPYNPYEPNRYNWGFVLKFFTQNVDLLIGPKFWDFLGGNGTYKELLLLFEEVRKDLEPDIRTKMEKYLSEFEEDSKFS